MKLQKYLIEFGLNSLISKYNIIAKYHKEFPELVQLTYDQLKTPKNDITNDCRGIIFDCRDWSIVAWPFTRFNDFEPKVKTNFDFLNFKAFEKIDGSMMTVYWYANKWQVASKSLPDASGFVWNLNPEIKQTYHDYFWKVWKKLKYLMAPLNKDCSYIFEFKFPSETQFLTKSEKESITLIGIRNIKTENEICLENFQYELVMTKTQMNWKIVQDYFLTFKDVLEITRDLNPIESEGFVICDSNFNRLKVKSPLYDRISLLRKYNGDFKHDEKVKDENFNRLCSIIKYGINNKHLETFLKFYPDCVSDFNKILKIYKKIINDLVNEIKKTKFLTKSQLGLFTQKKSKFGKLLFPLHDFLNSNIENSIEEFFYNFENRNFVNLIKNYK